MAAHKCRLVLTLYYVFTVWICFLHLVVIIVVIFLTFPLTARDVATFIWPALLCVIIISVIVSTAHRDRTSALATLIEAATVKVTRVTVIFSDCSAQTRICKHTLRYLVDKPL